MTYGRGNVLNLSALDLMSQLQPGFAGAFVFDPPFHIGFGRARTGHALHNHIHGHGNDPWSPSVSNIEEMIDWSIPYAKEVYRVLRPGGACVVLGGAESISAWEVAAQRAGLLWMADLTVLWNQGKPRRHNFGSLTTTIRWHTRPGARHVWASAQTSIYSNVIVATKIPPEERHHPAQKPVELTNIIVSLLTHPDDLVLDPFCGSGSTLVSAAMCGRGFVGGDESAAYCEIARTRVRDLAYEEDQLQPIYWWVNNQLKLIEGH